MKTELWMMNRFQSRLNWVWPCNCSEETPGSCQSDWKLRTSFAWIKNDFTLKMLFSRVLIFNLHPLLGSRSVFGLYVHVCWSVGGALTRLPPLLKAENHSAVYVEAKLKYSWPGRLTLRANQLYLSNTLTGRHSKPKKIQQYHTVSKKYQLL